MPIHATADVQSPHIGEGTTVWQHSIILPEAKVGKNCNICAFVFIENDVVIGDHCTIKPGVQLWNGVVIEDHVFVGPNATFTNDPFPRSKVYPKTFPKTVVKKGASIGANATLLPGVTVGEGALVGAGSVVTKDVAPYTVVFGNPARFIRDISLDNK